MLLTDRDQHAPEQYHHVFQASRARQRKANAMCGKLFVQDMTHVMLPTCRVPLPEYRGPRIPRTPSPRYSTAEQSITRRLICVRMGTLHCMQMIYSFYCQQRLAHAKC